MTKKMSTCRLAVTAELREEFPMGTAEGAYLDRVLYAFSDLDLPQSIETGVAMMEVLAKGKITLRSGMKVEDPKSYIPGTIEIADIVATAFSSISTDPYWWRERLFDAGREHEINMAKADLVRRLREARAVESVSGI